MGKCNCSFWNFLEDASKVRDEIKTSTPEELAEKAAEESVAELQKIPLFKTVVVLYELTVEHNRLMDLLVEKKILNKADVEKIEAEGKAQGKEWEEKYLAAQKADFKANYFKYFTEVKAEMDRRSKND